MPPNPDNSRLAPTLLKWSTCQVLSSPKSKPRVNMQYLTSNVQELMNIKPEKIVKNRRKMSQCGILATFFFEQRISK